MAIFNSYVKLPEVKSVKLYINAQKSYEQNHTNHYKSPFLAQTTSQNIREPPGDRVWHAHAPRTP